LQRVPRRGGAGQWLSGRTVNPGWAGSTFIVMPAHIKKISSSIGGNQVKVFSEIAYRPSTLRITLPFENL
jgi:hypothetical protein